MPGRARTRHTPPGEDAHTGSSRTQPPRRWWRIRVITRPKRADARRNYEKVLAAARDAFAAGGEAISLEEIARRAGVGIGTLTRHLPNRQALVEALYVNEAMLDSVSRLDDVGDGRTSEPDRV